MSMLDDAASKVFRGHFLCSFFLIDSLALSCTVINICLKINCYKSICLMRLKIINEFCFLILFYKIRQKLTDKRLYRIGRDRKV